MEGKVLFPIMNVSLGGCNERSELMDNASTAFHRTRHLYSTVGLILPPATQIMSSTVFDSQCAGFIVFICSILPASIFIQQTYVTHLQMCSGWRVFPELPLKEDKPCSLPATSQAVPVLPVAGGMMPPIPAMPIPSHHHHYEQHQQQQQYHQYNRPRHLYHQQTSPTSSPVTPTPQRVEPAPSAAASGAGGDADVMSPVTGVPGLPGPVVAGLPVMTGVPGTMNRVRFGFEHVWPDACRRDGIMV